jgi:AcrR family transcriptional regulator
VRTRKTAEERKAEILQAAMRLADELGPDRLSTEAIARAVGLTQPGIFRHFPTKQAIWEAVASAISDRMEAAWTAATRHCTAPIDRLRGIIDAQFRLIQSTPAIPAILFSRELHAENDVLRKAVFRLMGRFHDEVAGEITAAQASGAFWQDLVPSDAAFLLIGLVQGTAVRWSLSGRSFDLPEEGVRLLDLQLQMFSIQSAEAVERRRLA